jgi:hypothetical protein
VRGLRWLLVHRVLHRGIGQACLDHSLHLGVVVEPSDMPTAQCDCD